MISTKSRSGSREVLRGAGLRRTRARQVVLEALQRARRPVTHQEIAAEPDLRQLDRVTLYRTLASLARARLLHRVQGLDGAWRYCSHRAVDGRCGGDHIHFLCLSCHRMSCLPEQPLPWVEAPAGAEVMGKQLVVYGRCAGCGSAR
jgi:Fur family ferric uptake transcriptional regulator/Fur family zinc uptake transcriptional regulator